LREVREYGPTSTATLKPAKVPYANFPDIDALVGSSTFPDLDQHV